jgi:hypothetical protein
MNTAMPHPQPPRPESEPEPPSEPSPAPDPVPDPPPTDPNPIPTPLPAGDVSPRTHTSPVAPIDVSDRRVPRSIKVAQTGFVIALGPGPHPVTRLAGRGSREYHQISDGALR